MSADEVAAKVEAACAEVSSVSVWLPEHVAKKHLSLDEAKAVVTKAEDRFRSTLEALDPPDELRTPLEGLEQRPEPPGESLPAAKALLREKVSLYEQVGATRCAKELRAGILVIGGKSVREAFGQEGVPLPPHPPGW